MASDQDKCQEDNWTVDISDRAGEGEERSSEGTGKSSANELAFELRFKGWKAVSHANMHYKLWEVQVPRPWDRNKCPLFEEQKEAKWPKGQIQGASWRGGSKRPIGPMSPPGHGRKVKPKEPQWAAHSLTAYCEATSSNSFFCPQIKSFFKPYLSASLKLWEYCLLILLCVF